MNGKKQLGIQKNINMKRFIAITLLLITFKGYGQYFVDTCIVSLVAENSINLKYSTLHQNQRFCFANEEDTIEIKILEKALKINSIKLDDSLIEATFTENDLNFCIVNTFTIVTQDKTKYFVLFLKNELATGLNINFSTFLLITPDNKTFIFKSLYCQLLDYKHMYFSDNNFDGNIEFHKIDYNDSFFHSRDYTNIPLDDNIYEYNNNEWRLIKIETINCIKK